VPANGRRSGRGAANELPLPPRARYAIRPTSPILTGVLVQADLIGPSFQIAGAINATYDSASGTCSAACHFHSQATKRRSQSTPRRGAAPAKRRSRRDQHDVAYRQPSR